MPRLSTPGPGAPFARQGHRGPLPTRGSLRRRWLRSLGHHAPGGALALLLALAVLALAVPSKAQAEVLVSNLNQEASTDQLRFRSGDRRFSIAQGFTTGTSTGGYTLTSIEIPFQDDYTATEIGDLTAGVWSDDGSGNPNTELFALTKPTSIVQPMSTTVIGGEEIVTDGSAAVFTAPAGRTLDPSTTYHVVLAGGTETDPWATNSDVETGVAGWSIAHEGRQRQTVPTVGNWEGVNSTYTMLIRVNGEVGADTTAPTVMSIVRQDPTSSPTNADSLTWRVTFSEAVSNVDAADFAVNGTTATLSVSAVSGVTGAYDVTASGGNLASVNAMVTLSIDATGHGIQDAASNALTNRTPTGANDNSYVVDNTAPRVASIVRQTPSSSPTNANSLKWRITFSENVQNVDAADVAIAGTTATVAGVTEVTASTVYDVTASGGNLAGLDATVTLSFASGRNIADNADNALSNTTPTTSTNDNTYVVDNTAPTVTITGVSATSTAAFTATFTFSEAVTGFVVADITLGNATASSFSATSTTVYTALITATANGEVTVDVAASAARDAAGNGNTAATQASSNYTGPLVDSIAPRVASIVRRTPSSSPTNANSLKWRITFSENVKNVNAADFAIGGTTATLTVIVATASTVYDVTASGGNLAGLNATVTLSFASGRNIADNADNALSNPVPTGTNHNSYVVDNTAPTVAITGVSATSTAAFTATFTFSEAVTGFFVGDITLGNATASNFRVTSTTVYTAVITPTANGAVTVDVAASAARDAAGNGNRAATRASSTYTVVTAPGEPASLTARAGDAQVTLIWTPPALDGGAPIERYQYRHSAGSTVASRAPWMDVPDADSDGSLADERLVTVPDLDNARQYAFEVRAPLPPGSGFLVSNFGQTADRVASIFVTQDIVGVFTIGARGAELHNIEFRVFTRLPNLPLLPIPSVTLYRASVTDSRATQGERVAALTAVAGTPRSTDTAQTVAFAAPSGTRLEAGATYLVVLEHTFPVGVQYTNSSAQDAGGASGWTIDGVGAGNSSPWSYGTSGSLLMSVNGTTAIAARQAVGRVAAQEKPLAAKQEEATTPDPDRGISLSPSSASAIEGQAVTIGARRAGPTDRRTSVTVQVFDSALDGAWPMDLHFRSGAATATAAVSIPFDGARPASRTVTVRLASVGEPYSVGSPSRLTFNVTDRDAALSVRDARVSEGPGARLAFAVTLDRTRDREVRVKYATSDVTAKQGMDYTGVSGTLRFAPGETSKTVWVPVLDDAHDEGTETLVLRLSAARRAVIEDGEATGSIENSDSMPVAWMVRFGRTVGSQVVDALSGRLEGGRGSHLTVAGIPLGGTPAREPAPKTDDPFALPEWATPGAKEEEAHTLTAEDLLLRSSFHLRSGGEDGAGLAFTTWGHAATGGFQADDMKLDGSDTTGLIGFDAEWDRALAGVMLSHSIGEGSYRLDLAQGDDAETVKSDLTGVYPYARINLNARVSAWALAGAGSGSITLKPGGGDAMKMALSMRMGALGVKGQVLDGTGPSGMRVNVKSDAMWVGTKSARSADMVGSEGDATRLRLVAQGERDFALAGRGRLTPSAELGLRHDAGDAETGMGVELGAGLRYRAGSFTIEGQARTLVAHEASGYEDWGVSGAVRLTPSASGRGLSLSVAPTWGRTGSASERLWSARDAGELEGGGAFEADGRIEAEVGYGLALPHNRGLLTPYGALTLASEGGRTMRGGARWMLDSDLAVTLEATRSESAGTDAGSEVRIRAALRF